MYPFPFQQSTSYGIQQNTPGAGQVMTFQMGGQYFPTNLPMHNVAAQSPMGDSTNQSLTNMRRVSSPSSLGSIITASDIPPTVPDHSSTRSVPSNESTTVSDMQYNMEMVHTADSKYHIHRLQLY